MGVKKQGRKARGRGRAYPPRRALHPRGPLIAPPTYFFLLYISIYPKNIQEHHETLFPPPQPSVPKRSHLGAFSGSIFYHISFQSILFCNLYFPIYIIKIPKIFILLSLSDLTLVSDRVGIDNPLSRWLRGFICLCRCEGLVRGLLLD